MRLHPEVDLADPFWREQMFFSRLPAALSAVFVQLFLHAMLFVIDKDDRDVAWTRVKAYLGPVQGS